jgi:hypothetical protein
MRLMAVCLFLITPFLSGARIEGRVVDQLGQPVRQATVRLGIRSVFVSPTGTPQPIYVDVTDGEGKFTFDSLPPGDYAVSSSREGFTEAPGTRPLITLGAADTKSGLQLTLIAGAAISGHVMDQDGFPVGGIAVSLLILEYRSDGPESADMLMPLPTTSANSAFPKSPQVAIIW